jgi:hypothetical protein
MNMSIATVSVRWLCRKLRQVGEGVVRPFCGTDDPDVAKAFALYAGSSVEELAGTEFIVDQSGSLRSLWHPGLVPDWTNPKVFAKVVDKIRRTPSATHAAPGHTPRVLSPLFGLQRVDDQDGELTFRSDYRFRTVSLSRNSNECTPLTRSK